MKLQHSLGSTFALPLALCLLAQPLLADPSAIADTVPEIDVRQPAKTRLEDGYSKVSFGTLVLGASGTVRKFTVKNVGNGKLTDLRVTRNGANPKDFKVVQAAKTTLAPGATTTFSVTFKPAAKGLRSAVIHVKSNDTDEASFDIILTGKGQAP